MYVCVTGRTTVKSQLSLSTIPGSRSKILLLLNFYKLKPVPSVCWATPSPYCQADCRNCERDPGRVRMSTHMHIRPLLKEHRATWGLYLLQQWDQKMELVWLSQKWRQSWWVEKNKSEGNKLKTQHQPVTVLLHSHNLPLKNSHRVISNCRV